MQWSERLEKCENRLRTALCVVVRSVAISVREEIGDAAAAAAAAVTAVGDNAGGSHDDCDAEEAQPATGSIRLCHHDDPRLLGKRRKKWRRPQQQA